MSKTINIALAGNPNSGKTSLLNSLAGLKLHVGNWPGKTVEKKEAIINFSGQNLKIIDLPGIYSLLPFSEEEEIARDFIFKNNPDIIVQVIDVNSLEKSLFLLFEFLALEKKVILAFNFNKEAEANGVKMDVKNLEKILGVPIIKIEANTGVNKEALLKEIIKVSKNKFEQPAYLKNILNKNKTISHGRAIKFIWEKIQPFYFNPNKNEKSKKIDNFVLNKFTAFPIFFASMYLLFKLTFIISDPITLGVNRAISWLIKITDSYFSAG